MPPVYMDGPGGSPFIGDPDVEVRDIFNECLMGKPISPLPASPSQGDVKQLTLLPVSPDWTEEEYDMIASRIDDFLTIPPPSPVSGNTATPTMDDDCVSDNASYTYQQPGQDGRKIFHIPHLPPPRAGIICQNRADDTPIVLHSILQEVCMINAINLDMSLYTTNSALYEVLGTLTKFRKSHNSKYEFKFV
jgi:hypothetical protein